MEKYEVHPKVLTLATSDKPFEWLKQSCLFHAIYIYILMYDAIAMQFKNWKLQTYYKIKTFSAKGHISKKDTL